MNIANLTVKKDLLRQDQLGYYIVDSTSDGRKYLNKQGAIQDNTSTGDCWWPTRKSAMDFVLDMSKTPTPRTDKEMRYREETKS